MSAFIRNETGSLAMTAALLLGVVAVASAGAADVSSAVSVKRNAQSITDAAAIVAATQDKKAGEAYFRARFAALANERATLKQVKVTSKDGVGTVETEFEMQSFFGTLGLGNSLVKIDSAAQAGSNIPIDVVMALDYSGSMGVNNKYVRMKEAAHDFLDTFIGGSYQVRAGLVPFAKHGLVQLDGRYLFDSYNGGSLLGGDYLACIGNRGYPHAVEVTTPTEPVEASLWPAVDYAAVGLGGNDGDWASANPYGNPPPWLYDAGPDAVAFDAGFYVEYLNDGLRHSGFVTDLAQISGDDIVIAATDLAARKTLSDGSKAWVWGSSMCNFETAWRAGQCGDPPSPPSYAGTSGTTDPGTESFAPNATIALHKAAESLSPSCKAAYDRNLMTRPLSSDLEGVKSEISSMTPGGLTNISLAFDLAWHAVSNNAPWTEGGDGTEAQKVVILLSDGVQTVKAPGPNNQFSISAANKNTQEICTAMKTAGVTVYTVAFGLNDGFTRNLLKDCATSLDHYFEPGSGDTLDETFSDIARSLKSPARIIR